MTAIEEICNWWFILSGKVLISTMIIPIICAIFYKKYFLSNLRLFLGYCLLTFLFNLLDYGYYMLMDNYTNRFERWLSFTNYNLLIFQILHQLKNFALLGWFYSKLLKGYTSSNWLKKLTIILCIVSIVFYIIEEGWRNYGTVAPTIEAIFLFVIPFFYLWYLFKTDLALPLHKNPFFWISLGLVIPNLLGLFLYFVGDSIQETDFCLFTRYAITKNGFEVIGQIMFAIAFSRARFAKYVYNN